jgi:hypothetical protein
MPDFMDSFWSYAVSAIAFGLYAEKAISVESKRVWFWRDFRMDLQV